MQTPEKVDSLFVFESGSINTIIKDNHGTIYTNESENNEKKSPKKVSAQKESAANDTPPADASSFKDCLVPSIDRDKLISLLHDLIDTKHGNKERMLPIFAIMEIGYTIKKIPYKFFCEEFGPMTESAYSRWTSGKYQFKQESLEAVISEITNKIG